MMHSHRGARPDLPWAQQPDRRVNDLDAALRVLESTSSASRAGFIRDSARANQVIPQLLAPPARLVVGLVVHAIPHVNWYKVQLGGVGDVGACFLSSAGLSPLGPRPISMARPGDLVLVHVLLNRPSIIMGVLPPALLSATVARPDWVVQGGGAGIQTEQAHSFPITGHYQQGGVVDYAAGKPLDQTAYEQGWITATGLAVTIDDFMIQVRANEMCGLWLSYFDSWCRLAGLALDIESAVHVETARDDEGESHYIRGVAAYPWEALGLYAPGRSIAQAVAAKIVQFGGQKAALDLPDGAADVQPLYRYSEHGGYLGQGHLRTVSAPIPASSGVRLFQDAPADVGLFREAIGLDGSYTLLSAKAVHVGKRTLIPVPKQHQVPESGQGDDSAAGSYKFSSQFGDTDAHKVGDVAVAGEQTALRRIAGVDDLIAYDANWKPIHPFHYHTKDWEVPQEGRGPGPFRTVQEHLDYTALAAQTYLPDPTPVQLKIDQRYGDVNYYLRESFFRCHEDGSVHIACGAGAEIVLAGGKIRLAAPGGIDLLAGTDLVAFADQIVLRAQGSIDLSSSHKDVRVKADQNVQVLAGNSGRGGVLIESAGQGSAQDYVGKFGEDVVGAGVVLRAPSSPVAVLSESIYLHTLGVDGPAEGGDIVLDAAQGNADVKIFAANLTAAVAAKATLACGPHDAQSRVQAVFVFAQDNCVLDAPVNIGGSVVVYADGDLTVPGAITVAGDMTSAGTVFSQGGGPTAKAPTGTPKQVRQEADNADDQTTDAKTEAQADQENTFALGLYAAGELGNSALTDSLHFSYRDPPGGDQYHAAGLVWPECRWQAFARLGTASGGVAWTEPPVMCQGEPTYPYPGRAQWVEGQAFFQLQALNMFDPATGAAVPRPGPYETPSLAAWTKTSMAAGYTLNRQEPGTSTLTAGE